MHCFVYFKYATLSKTTLKQFSLGNLVFSKHIGLLNSLFTLLFLLFFLLFHSSTTINLLTVNSGFFTEGVMHPVPKLQIKPKVYMEIPAKEATYYCEKEYHGNIEHIGHICGKV